MSKRAKMKRVEHITISVRIHSKGALGLLLRPSRRPGNKNKNIHQGYRVENIRSASPFSDKLLVGDVVTHWNASPLSNLSSVQLQKIIGASQELGRFTLKLMRTCTVDKASATSQNSVVPSSAQKTGTPFFGKVNNQLYVHTNMDGKKGGKKDDRNAILISGGSITKVDAARLKSGRKSTSLSNDGVATPQSTGAQNASSTRTRTSIDKDVSKTNETNTVQSKSTSPSAASTKVQGSAKTKNKSTTGTAKGNGPVLTYKKSTATVNALTKNSGVSSVSSAKRLREGNAKKVMAPIKTNTTKTNATISTGTRTPKSKSTVARGNKAVGVNQSKATSSVITTRPQAVGDNIAKKLNEGTAKKAIIPIRTNTAKTNATIPTGTRTPKSKFTVASGNKAVGINQSKATSSVITTRPQAVGVNIVKKLNEGTAKKAMVPIRTNMAKTNATISTGTPKSKSTVFSGNKTVGINQSKATSSVITTRPQAVGVNTAKKLNKGTAKMAMVPIRTNTAKTNATIPTGTPKSKSTVASGNQAVGGNQSKATSSVLTALPQAVGESNAKKLNEGTAKKAMVPTKSTNTTKTNATISTGTPKSKSTVFSGNKAVGGNQSKATSSVMTALPQAVGKSNAKRLGEGTAKKVIVPTKSTNTAKTNATISTGTPKSKSTVFSGNKAVGVNQSKAASSVMTALPQAVGESNAKRLGDGTAKKTNEGTAKKAIIPIRTNTAKTNAIISTGTPKLKSTVASGNQAVGGERSKAAISVMTALPQAVGESNAKKLNEGTAKKAMVPIRTNTAKTSATISTGSPKLKSTVFSGNKAVGVNQSKATSSAMTALPQAVGESNAKRLGEGTAKKAIIPIRTHTVNTNATTSSGTHIPKSKSTVFSGNQAVGVNQSKAASTVMTALPQAVGESNAKRLGEGTAKKAMVPIRTHTAKTNATISTGTVPKVAGDIIAKKANGDTSKKTMVPISTNSTKMNKSISTCTPKSKPSVAYIGNINATKTKVITPTSTNQLKAMAKMNQFINTNIANSKSATTLNGVSAPSKESVKAVPSTSSPRLTATATIAAKGRTSTSLSSASITTAAAKASTSTSSPSSIQMIANDKVGINDKSSRSIATSSADKNTNAKNKKDIQQLPSKRSSLDSLQEPPKRRKLLSYEELRNGSHEGLELITAPTPAKGKIGLVVTLNKSTKSFIIKNVLPISPFYGKVNNGDIIRYFDGVELASLGAGKFQKLVNQTCSTKAILELILQRAKAKDSNNLKEKRTSSFMTRENNVKNWSIDSSSKTVNLPNLESNQRFGLVLQYTRKAKGLLVLYVCEESLFNNSIIAGDLLTHLNSKSLEFCEVQEFLFKLQRGRRHKLTLKHVKNHETLSKDSSEEKNHTLETNMSSYTSLKRIFVESFVFKLSGAATREGVIVTDIDYCNSELSGIRKGDIITQFCGQSTKLHNSKCVWKVSLSASERVSEIVFRQTVENAKIQDAIDSSRFTVPTSTAYLHQPIIPMDDLPFMVKNVFNSTDLPRIQMDAFPTYYSYILNDEKSKQQADKNNGFVRKTLERGKSLVKRKLRATFKSAKRAKKPVEVRAAKDFPMGWTEEIYRRGVSSSGCSYKYLFSPKMKYKFRTMKSAQMFLDALRQVNNDEKAAYELIRTVI